MIASTEILLQVFSSIPDEMGKRAPWIPLADVEMIFYKVSGKRNGDDREAALNRRCQGFYQAIAVLPSMGLAVGF